MLRLLKITAALSFASSIAFPSLAASTPGSYPVSVSQSDGPLDFGFSRAEAHFYTATVHVNGVPYQLILDSGSSDTWIDPWSLNMSDPPNLIQTGYNSSTTYVDGTVSTGAIVLADLTLGPYTIKNQAITISHNASKSPSQFNGLLGLGGTAHSKIHLILGNTSFADNSISVMFNLFKNQPDLPSYMTWLMSRSEVGINDGGVLTISDVLANMTDVLAAPSFKSLYSNSWTTALDGIYVNGEFVTAQTQISNETLDKYNISLPSNSVLATFDTGSSAILGPRAFADAIYKNIPGAQPAPPDGSNQTQYIIPCNSKVNVTWSFSGNLYPMHPIDTSAIFQFPNGSFMCIGNIVGGDASPDEDILLGANFLVNTYQLYDYGTPDPSSMPSIRLLSTTDAEKAWAEADSLSLARILAYEARLNSMAGVSANTSATGSPAYTGPSGPAPSLTAIFNNGTWTPTATPSSAPSSTIAITSDTAVATSHTENSAPSVSTLTVTATVTTTATVDASATKSVQADVRIAGAVAEDDTNPKAVDLSGLTRNSYIILGLLGAALVMLIVVAALLARSSRANKAYRAVPSGNFAQETKHLAADGESAYSTPYDDRS